MSSRRVLAISGSLRAGSSNAALLHAAARIAPAGMEIRVYEGLGSLPHFNPDLDREGEPAPKEVAALRAEISAARGLIVASPEYAHGVPGSLKNALDWLVSWPDFAGLPVVLWNASAAGGQFAQASLVETLRTMSARVLVERCLLEPFLRRKLAPGCALDEVCARAVIASLDALWRAMA